MSYPPIMVRQWPFDGYSRQPVELDPRLGEEAQIRLGPSWPRGQRLVEPGCCDPAPAYRAALASAKREWAGPKRLAGYSQCGIKVEHGPIEVEVGPIERAAQAGCAILVHRPSPKRNTAQRAKPSWRIQTVRIAPNRLRTTIAARMMPFSRQTLTAIAW
jgi:hypothetical protein